MYIKIRNQKKFFSHEKKILLQLGLTSLQIYLYRCQRRSIVSVLVNKQEINCDQPFYELCSCIKYYNACKYISFPFLLIFQIPVIENQTWDQPKPTYLSLFIFISTTLSAFFIAICWPNRKKKSRKLREINNKRIPYMIPLYNQYYTAH